MIEFKRNILDNGLKILVHEDRSTPLVAMNIVYNVGSRDEDPEMTGMAHLFEHLMFGGSKNIANFDTPLQMAGADNNAFTNNDLTDYYITIPANNLETAFWLESDRMLGLSFSKEVLDVQKKVVSEEFKLRYLNQPYGDIMLLLRPMAYKVHPYQWPTIGKDISHISKIRMKNVRDFFYSHYAPDNAIITIAGNINNDEVLKLSNKWFGPIKNRNIPLRILPVEPEQNEKRMLEVEKDVPSNVIYKAWHVCHRMANEFYTLDLLTDILAGGESGRLYESLVREKKLFGDINSYVTGDHDPGLLIISGKLMDGVSFEQAEHAIGEVLEELKTTPVPPTELEKVKNKFESSTLFSNSNVLNKAMFLGFFELLGDAQGINKQVAGYCKANQEMVMEASEKYLNPSKCSTLYYKSAKTGRKK